MNLDTLADEVAELVFVMSAVGFMVPVPESKKTWNLMREMKSQRYHELVFNAKNVLIVLVDMGLLQR